MGVPATVAQLIDLTARHLATNDGTVTLHLPGPAMRSCLTEFEATTHHVVMNMQRYFLVSVHRAAIQLDANSRARGVREQTVVDRSAAVRMPLLSSFEPSVRITSVPAPLVVSDHRRALLPVPAGHGPPEGCCFTEDPPLVRIAVDAFSAVWDRSVPWQEAGLRPPLDPRRLRVAIQLLRGDTDKRIAYDLGVSQRTVSAEVRAIVDWLGARNRGHAVAMLVGAG